MNKLTHEQIQAITGTLPLIPEGKQITGLKMKIPQTGDTFHSVRSSSWYVAEVDFDAPRLVPIYEDTQKEAKRPEATLEGHTIAYYSADEMREAYKAGDVWGAYLEGDDEWTPISDFARPSGSRATYCIATPIQKTTTIDDLIAGYIHTPDGCFESIYIFDNHGPELEVNHWAIVEHINMKNRWSHSHKTAYSDAREFVGGEDE